MIHKMLVGVAVVYAALVGVLLLNAVRKRREIFYVAWIVGWGVVLPIVLAFILYFQFHHG